MTAIKINRRLFVFRREKTMQFQVRQLVILIPFLLGSRFPWAVTRDTNPKTRRFTDLYFRPTWIFWAKWKIIKFHIWGVQSRLSGFLQRIFIIHSVHLCVGYSVHRYGSRCDGCVYRNLFSPIRSTDRKINGGDLRFLQRTVLHIHEKSSSRWKTT